MYYKQSGSILTSFAFLSIYFRKGALELPRKTKLDNVCRKVIKTINFADPAQSQQSAPKSLCHCRAIIVTMFQQIREFEDKLKASQKMMSKTNITPPKQASTPLNDAPRKRTYADMNSSVCEVKGPKQA